MRSSVLSLLIAMATLSTWNSRAFGADSTTSGSLVVFDTPEDAGESITLQWNFPGSVSTVSRFELHRRSQSDAEFYPLVDIRPASDRGPFEYVDQGGDLAAPARGDSYEYRVSGLDSTGRTVWQATAGPVEPAAQWFYRSRLLELVAGLCFFSAVLYFIARSRGGKSGTLRSIPALKAMEEAVGRAVETGRPILFVPGTTDLDEPETVAGIVILGHVSRLAARYDAKITVPVSRSMVMEASKSLVEESYRAEGKPDRYSNETVSYLTENQFAYVAGLDGKILREKPAACFYQGQFFAESLILAETGSSVGAIQIAGTGSAHQVPFLIAACDHVLVGEEFFAAGAYLSKDPRRLGSLKGQDAGKVVVAGSLILGCTLETLNAIGWISFSVAEWISR